LEQVEMGDVENRQEFYDLWLGYYPDEIKWYKLTFISYNDVHYTDFDGKLVFQISPEPQKVYTMNNSELAMWLTDAVDRAIEMLRNETYNQFVAENLLYHT